MVEVQPLPLITDAPAFASNRLPLAARKRYDFADFGFILMDGGEFEIVPINLTDDEAFIFFFSRDDIAQKRYSFFNFHVFLRYSGSVEQFARSRGKSLENVALSTTQALWTSALIYKRQILMRDLFEGAESVIEFIGGQPDLLVCDSHLYFQHRHNHCYSGMVHLPGEEHRYDRLRQSLFEIIRLV